MRHRLPNGVFCVNKRAFSLVEILVVLIILAIMTTVALFSYSNYHESQSLRTSANEVRRILMQARNRAIHLNLPHEVVINLDRESLWVNELNNTKTDFTPRVVPEKAVNFPVVIDEVRVGSTVFTSGDAKATFETDGQNPMIVVLLRRESDDPTVDENFYSVRIFPTSGEAQILEGQKL